MNGQVSLISMCFYKVILFHLEILMWLYSGLFWCNLSAVTVVFIWYFMKDSRKWSEEVSIFSKLQVYENTHEGFSFSVTLKLTFANNVLLQIFSLVESCFIEIRVLLPVTLQKELSQISFLGISRTNTLQRCIQTQSNI